MIIFEAAYSKKLGLPNYSSHSYVVSVRVELQDINQVPDEGTRLYKMLQDAADKEIQAVGFMPDATKYGMGYSSAIALRNKLAGELRESWAPQQSMTAFMFQHGAGTSWRIGKRLRAELIGAGIVERDSAHLHGLRDLFFSCD